MAIVQYQVLYKYVHPTTRAACSNNTTASYDETTKFIKAYKTGETLIQLEETITETDSSNPKYDMVFVYDGVSPINRALNETIYTKTSGSNYDPVTVVTENFIRCKGEVWFVASTHASLNSAINSTKSMVKSLGTGNVKVAKLVPLEISVGIE